MILRRTVSCGSLRPKSLTKDVWQFFDGLGKFPAGRIQVRFEHDPSNEISTQPQGTSTGWQGAVPNHFPR